MPQNKRRKTPQNATKRHKTQQMIDKSPRHKKTKKM
jgi:hypothetical protein